MIKRTNKTVRKVLSALIEGLAMGRHFGGVRTTADLVARIDTWNQLTSSKPACCCKN